MRSVRASGREVVVVVVRTVPGVFLCAALAVFFCSPSDSFAAGTEAGRVFYVGAFDGMGEPLDASDCGPAPKPCATLAFWTAGRSAVLAPGDTVRIAPGVYSSSGGSTDNCILAAAGVTYEGRAANDTALDDFESVVIDLDGCGSQGLCKCTGVRHDRGDVSGFTVRNLRIRGGTAHGTSGQNAGIRFHTAGSGVVSSGITVDRVWVDDIDNQGIVFNMPVSPMVDCGPRGMHENDLGDRRGELRTYRDIVIKDSKVTFVRGVFGGIVVGCVDGALIENNVVSDIYDGDYAACPGGAGCDNHDGIQISGLVHAAIRRNKVSRAGQDSLGIGGHFKSSYHLLVESNEFLPSAKRVAKVSGQAGPDIVFRNNFFGSENTPFTTTACASGLSFQNNTFRDVGSGQTLILFDACDGCEFVNNVIVGSPAASTPVIGVSTAATDGGLHWDGNVVSSDGEGPAIIEYQYVAEGCAPPGCCAPQGCGCNDGVSLCELPPYCTAERFAPQVASGRSGGLADADLDAFRVQSDDGQWFGPGSGDHDVWGVTPEFVDPDVMSAAGHHLSPNDQSARDAGLDLASWFGADIDGDPRGPLWDIGMDELTGALPACGSDAECDDGNPCTGDRCEQGGCTHAPVAVACDDGDACTVGDACVSGACVGGAPRSCDDGNVCTNDLCDPAGGCSHPPATAACDDGDRCTQGDVCREGTCVAGAPLACDDGNVCTDDRCDPTLGCTYANNGAGCDDGNACTDGDLCVDGGCVGGESVACDDRNVCTNDRCDAVRGCVFEPNTAPCDDGDACTTNDACATGACVGGLPVSCDDANECTRDLCDADAGCLNRPEAGPCDDGDPCTVGDACTADGGCAAGAPLDCSVVGDPCRDAFCDPEVGCTWLARDGATCDDGNACTRDDVCRDGLCVGTESLACDDSNGCTDDRCDLDLGCIYVNNAATCDDGNACTTGDVCSAGACVGGSPVGCDDGNPCTDDRCDSSRGCVYAGNTAACDDGDACTTGDLCSAGTCLGGAVLVCDDGNACTDDGCDAATGCRFEANAAPCDDGIGCTADDACAAGRCVGVDACASDQICDVAFGVCTDNSVDELEVVRAFYRESSGAWFVRGIASDTGPDNVVSVYAGPDATGPIVGTATVDDTGTWRVFVREGPDAGRPASVSATSTAGGAYLDGSVIVR